MTKNLNILRTKTAFKKLSQAWEYAFNIKEFYIGVLATTSLDITFSWLSS